MLQSDLNQMESFIYNENPFEKDECMTKFFIAFKIMANNNEEINKIENLVQRVDSVLKSTSKSIPIYYKVIIFGHYFTYLIFLCFRILRFM